jgi:predicted secreted protein
MQSGLAETFQLALGGKFGAGPAWQNRLETGLSNLLVAGDSLAVLAGDSTDLRSLQDNWQAGAGYRRPVWTRGRQQLALGAGFQHWKFRGVKQGTNDWLTQENLVWRYAGRIPVMVTSDSWTLLKSPLPTGTLLHTQAWMEHRVTRSEHPRILFRHGPAHTYSWGFYGTHGHRIMRYQTMVALAWGQTRIEGGYRKQWGLQAGIPDNTYWQFGITRSIVR